MNDLAATLLHFDPISLEEMDHVKLLNRIDTKYVIHQDKLYDYLKAISPAYSLLTIDGKSIHPYETLYFDTSGFHLYQMHHNGKRNRFKLRFRKYVNSGTTYFEIKSKTNKSRTIKNRILIDRFAETLDEKLVRFIGEHTPGEYHNFVPALTVFFDRLTFVNKNANERLTVDLNLRYSSNSGEKQIQNLVIIEVKEELHAASPFRQLMKLQRQTRNYFSKYCIGVTCLNKDLKMNRFKKKIISFNKLGYDIF
jgi:hypothetical protein